MVYFVIEQEGSREITEKQTLTVDKSGFTGRSKYQMLNAMLQMKERGQTEDLCRMEEEYLRQEQQIGQLFPLID